LSVAKTPRNDERASGSILSYRHALQKRFMQIYLAITAWAAPEQAAKHITERRGNAKAIFDTHNIPIGRYTLLAGFDEFLIRDGVGLLQQVHIYTYAEVDRGSPLLMRLGEAFSPFSSCIYTPSMTVRLPIFKADGTVWDFDKFVCDTVLKLNDYGNSRSMSPTVIQWARGRYQDGNMSEQQQENSSFSLVAGSAKNASDDHNRKEGTEDANQQKDGLLDENISGGNNGADKGDQSRAGDFKASMDNDRRNGFTGISFETVSEIFSLEQMDVSQTIKSKGKISIQVKLSALQVTYHSHSPPADERYWAFKDMPR